ncbi:mannosylfructose-phosphate phosphatase [Rhizobium sp. Root274]|uniref:HAD family hydrolase n=1 Tax=unclassified Rhizobium TaxID=2613769 RepID=UPI00071408AD|nr:MULTISPECIES: HAD family hydrolase [unclassified Rhizobium]KQW31581.1 mannosylfructose-phosphate phosphatase [Rhizobium sp. Root1240]KRD33121.1 mannosylfructose-phosphate phosphatase [Rhizobium sp. Root274]
MNTIQLFCSDLDGTLAGDRDGAHAFARHWSALPDDRRPLLVYNSGRLVEDILAFTAEEGLPMADFVIGGVGTMLHSEVWPHLGDAYRATLDRGFDVDRVEALLRPMERLSRQPDHYQHRLKSSWYLHDACPDDLEAIKSRLHSEGQGARVVYSSNRDLDIIPSAADKGQALRWLCTELGIRLSFVVVAGDTGNDRAMFELEGVTGILPENALGELSSLAQGRKTIVRGNGQAAWGVLDGLRQLGLLDPG